MESSFFECQKAKFITCLNAGMSSFLTKDSLNDVENSGVVDTTILPPAVPRLTLKKTLYHPLTGLAIAAHLLLLIVPFNKPQSSTSAPEITEDASDDAIPVDILNLSVLSKPAPPAPNVADPPPPPLAAPVAPVAPPVAPPVAAVIPEALPVEALPAESPVEQQPAEQPSASPVEEQLPAYIPKADQEAFISEGIEALSAGTNGIKNYREIGLPPEAYFDQGNAVSFLDYRTNPPSLVAGSIDAVWMDKQAERVAEQIETTYGPNGVQLVPLTPYQGELLYEMLTPNNDTMMFISLVNFPSKGSSLMVTWSVNPLGS